MESPKARVSAAPATSAIPNRSSVLRAVTLSHWLFLDALQLYLISQCHLYLFIFVQCIICVFSLDVGFLKKRNLELLIFLHAYQPSKYMVVQGRERGESVLLLSALKEIDLQDCVPSTSAVGHQGLCRFVLNSPL